MAEFHFERVGIKYGRPDEYLTNKEWQQRGIEIFVENVLKHGETETYKSLDELIDVFVKIGLFTLEAQAREAINHYSHMNFQYKNSTLHIDLVENPKRDRKYRIQIIG